jgi:mRNA interferase MazF
MTNYKQKEIILVDFVFSESSGSKKRPALIISNNKYHNSRDEIIIMAITSNIERILFGDTKIEKWKEAGLLYPSLIVGIIRTIKNTMIIKTLGILQHNDFINVKKNILKTFE